MLNSPRMVTRRFIKTPSQPTPKLFAFSFSQNDVLTYDLNKNETFENELDKIQN